MSRFQACVGPSFTKLHIREIGQEKTNLTICERIAVVQDYKASVPVVKICQACLRKLPTTEINAALIGVREIT